MNTTIARIGIILTLLSGLACSTLTADDRSQNGQQRRNPSRQLRRAKVPDNVKPLYDVAYAQTNNPRQALDLFLPEKPASDMLPVVVFIHGGGWQNGDKIAGQRWVMPYVESGQYAGISVGYRLSGEAIWPSQIHDCKAAIRWIRGNAKEHGLDPERVAVIGTSAGGHLVAMLGTTGDVDPLEGDLGEHVDESSRVTCVVDFYGPTDLLTMDDAWTTMKHNAPHSPESKLIGGPIQENKDMTRKASPLTYVTKDDAPILIIHGTNDPLVPYDQSVRFDRALDDAGVTSTLIEVKEGKHGGFNNPHIDRIVRGFIDDRLIERAKVKLIDQSVTAGQPRPR